MPFAVAAKAAIEDDVETVELPPLTLRLRARADGSLGALQLSSMGLASLKQLKAQLMKIVGDGRGPGTLSETLRLEMDVGDKLHVRHVHDAHAAVAGYIGADREMVPLLQKVYFFSPRGEALVETEVLSPKELTPGETDPANGPPESSIRAVSQQR